MYGASGIWIRVEPRDVACPPTGSVSIDPGDAANSWKPLAGPSGSVTIKFNSTGGHVVKFKVAEDGNDSAFYDEKPMKEPTVHFRWWRWWRHVTHGYSRYPPYRSRQRLRD